MILSIDTFSAMAGVALTEGEQERAAWSDWIPNGHSEQLMPAIVKILSGAGVTRPNAVAVCGGPGSFTGLRIGFSVAKGLALGWNCPFLVVPTFQAWEHRLASDPAIAEIGCLIDARQGDWYGRHPDGRLACQSLDAWLSERSGTRAWMVESDQIPVREGVRIESWKTYPDAGRLAVSVGILAGRRLAKGESDDVFVTEPVYIKDFVARIPGNPSLI